MLQNGRALGEALQVSEEFAWEALIPDAPYLANSTAPKASMVGAHDETYYAADSAFFTLVVLNCVYVFWLSFLSRRLYQQHFGDANRALPDEELSRIREQLLGEVV